MWSKRFRQLQSLALCFSLALCYYVSLSRPAPRISRVSVTNEKCVEKAIEEYAAFHAHGIESIRAGKPVQVLVYECHGSQRCGGLGNRLEGILSAFYVAVATRRVFVIDSHEPFPLDETLEPSSINWNIMSLLNTRDHGSNETIDLIDHNDDLENLFF